MTLRRRVFEIVEAASSQDRASRAFDLFIISLIVLNIAAMVLESVPAIGGEWAGAFRAFEIVSVGIFTVEYIARVWSCVESPRFAGPIGGRLRFAATPMGVVDLLAIVPAYLPMIGIDLRVARALRLFRLARVAKLGRYTRALELIRRAFYTKREPLVMTVLFMSTLILLAASLMYYAERDAQPEHFGSIPAAMWWAVVTLTTVGYGDAFPVTAIGRVLAAVMAVLGVGMVALPTGILGAAFVEQIADDRMGEPCPHCGRPTPGRPGG